MARALAQAVGVLVTAALAPVAVHGGGNLQGVDSSGDVISRVWDPRQLPIRWMFSQDGLPGSGLGNATLIAQIQGGFDAWEGVATASLDFEFAGEVPFNQTSAGVDGRNLVTFTDPNIDFPIGVAALAFTFSFGQDTVIDATNNDLDGDGTPDLASGTYPAGTIFDADVVFDSNQDWAVSGQPGTLDVRAVATHEVGHLIGLSHTGVPSAVMWPFLAADIADARTPDPDDVAWASRLYPFEPLFSTTFGSVSGRVTNGFTAVGIFAAHVHATDAVTGRRVVGAFTDLDGRYVLPGLAPGEYLIGIEPLDGEPVGLDPFRINEVVAQTLDTNFPEEFFDAEEAAVEADPGAAITVVAEAANDLGGIDLVTNTLSLPGQVLILRNGYNLVSYPVELPAGTSAFDLLAALGGPGEVSALDRFVPGTSYFERAEYEDGVPSGTDFSIRRGEGYVVHMGVDAAIGIAGGTSCPAVDLRRGLNLVGVPCPPPGYSAFDLLRDAGEPLEVESVERFDADTGAFQQAAYDSGGQPAGDDFPIVNGEAYVVHMKASRAGVALDGETGSFAPVLEALNPGRGVPGTTVLLLGRGFDPDPADNLVRLGTLGVVPIRATTTSLSVAVPPSALSGPVSVTVGALTSNAIDFVVEEESVEEEPAGELELITGQTAHGALASDGEQDRYTFTAVEGSRVTVSARSAAPGVPNLLLLLEDPYGFILTSDDDGGMGTDPLIHDLPLPRSGVFTIVVTNVPGSGAGDYELSLSVVPPAGSTRLSILDGNHQSTTAGAAFDEPLTVLATGPSGHPMAGAPITFTASNAELGEAGSVVLYTNESGVVRVEVTAPSQDGGFEISVSIPGLGDAVTFQVGVTEVAVAEALVTGNGQTGTVDQVLSAPLSVQLRDASGNPVPEAHVAFEVLTGGGRLGSAGEEQVVLQSNASGVASTTFKLGTDAKKTQIVACHVPGRVEPILFEATAVAGAPHAIRILGAKFLRANIGMASLRPFRIEVLDSFRNPVPNVDVTFESSDEKLALFGGLGVDGTFRSFVAEAPNRIRVGTDETGVSLAGFSAPAEDLVPNLDEFGNASDDDLAPNYEVSATVGGQTHAFEVQLGMGPEVLPRQGQNEDALIGQVLPNGVVIHAFRYERVDSADEDPDYTNENFETLTEKNIPDVDGSFMVRRADGQDGAALDPVTLSELEITTDVDGRAEVDVTMGDVRGTTFLLLEVPSITVDFERGDGSLITTQTFQSSTGASLGTNVQVIARPVVIEVAVQDPLVGTPPPSGIDLSKLRMMLNGTPFLDLQGVSSGGRVPLVVFPRTVEFVLSGAPMNPIEGVVVEESTSPSAVVRYYPAASELSPNNVVAVDPVLDNAGNEVVVPDTQFSYP